MPRCRHISSIVGRAVRCAVAPRVCVRCAGTEPCVIPGASAVGLFPYTAVLLKALAMPEQDQAAEPLDTLLETDLDLLREKLTDTHPEDIADLIRNVGVDRAAKLLAHLPPEYAAQVLERLDQGHQEQMAERMDS
jgi:hypothetical protein